MCSWLILLFFLFRCNNGWNMCCDNDCDRNRRNDRSWERNNSCGCEDEFVQPRAFSGFQNQGTCGCETKEE